MIRNFKFKILNPPAGGLPTTNYQLPTDLGFTLIEILVAATIIGLLATIGLSGFQAITRSGRDALRKTDLEHLRSALEIYKSEIGAYPTTIPTLVPNYVNPAPLDPKPTTYQYKYLPTGNTTYNLCAHLENMPGPTDYCQEPGPAGNQCGAGANCNYKVENP